MATTKTPTTRKPAAKKTAARKPAAKQTAARKPAAKLTVPSMPAADDVAGRVEDAMADAVKFMRDVTHTYVGMGLVVQDRIVHRGATDKATFPNFLDEAKAKGEARMNELQGRFEPIVQRVADRFEPVTERIESRLPAPVKEALETSRERVRKVLAA